MVLLNRIKNTHTHTHTHCSAPKGVKGPPVCYFHLPYSQFAKSLRHEQTLTHRQLALLLFYMISLCDLFQIQIIQH